VLILIEVFDRNKTYAASVPEFSKVTDFEVQLLINRIGYVIFRSISVQSSRDKIATVGYRIVICFVPSAVS